RQFIEIDTTEDATHPGDPLVVSHRLTKLVVVLVSHGAEFVDAKTCAPDPIALLPVKDRPRAVDTDREGDERQKRSENHERKDSADDVESAFGNRAGARQWPRIFDCVACTHLAATSTC